jgi:hypothetical protein
MMVLLEGGVRFSYTADALAVLPASYGLNVANRWVFSGKGVQP